MKKWIAAMLAVAACVGCRREEIETTGPEAKAGEKITVCLLPKLKGIPYFTSCYAGAKEAADELGDIELIYDGPTEGSAEAQAAMIEKWTLQGVDVIAVSPNAPDVIAKSMQEALKAGINVITWDADSTVGSREFFVNQATAQAIGVGLVDAMVNDLGGAEKAQGDVAIISANTTAANQNAWIEHMTARLKEHPNLNLVTIKYPGEDQNNAFQDAQDLMKAYPNLKGIWGITSIAFPGAAEAVKQADKAGQVLVVGLATPNDMKLYVKAGVVPSVVLWNTQDLGYLTVHTARALAKGTLKSGATEIEAGRLGKKVIAGDNVLLGDIMVFKKENIDQFDF